jgi:hypothetical protein
LIIVAFITKEQAYAERPNLDPEKKPHPVQSCDTPSSVRKENQTKTNQPEPKQRSAVAS